MGEIAVAIADDNERILDLLGEMIENNKEMKLVGKANNGEDVYTLIKEKQPDVVLLDLIMPKMDGLSVMDTVNRDHDIRKHPSFIIITAVGQERITEDAFRKGASYYILKPFSNQMVLDKIREAGKYHVPEAKSFAPVGNAEASEPKINLENRVTDMIHDQKIVRKRHFAIKSVLLVAALAAMSSILAIAHNYGAALIDDSNRHLVGKGLHGEGQIIGADEEIEVPDEPSDGIWETTARIKSYKNVSISPNSITEFAVSGDAGQYITPEIIFGNNDLVIFEQEDGSGWELNEGETLMIQATEYEAETNGGNGQGIMYFYICDGEILDGKSDPRKELNQTFELTAEKSGEYYICLLGVSSDPISLKEGKIVIK